MAVPRGILFDAGNTLVQLDHDLLGQRAGVVPDRVRAAELRARIELDAHLGRGGGSTESRGFLTRYLSLIWQELGQTRGWEPLVAERHRLWTRADPEAAPVLTALARDARLQLGVVSNSDGTLAELLGRLELDRHLRVIIDSGCVGMEKPDPAIFELALDRLGLPAAAVWYVGDLYHVDVVGAARAGLQPILLDPAGLRPSLEVPCIRSLAALLELVPA
jgi:HAD superfamily hydrolase (TIGR01549 family)